jgi:hypothetical protein
MGVIGTSGGGYATVLPTQGNPIGDAMANVENSAFRYSAQKMAKEKMKQDAERDLYDRRRQEFADAQQFSKENPFVATGMDIDGANMQGYMNFKDSANNAMSEFYKTGDQKQKAIFMNAVAGAKAIGEMPNQLNNLQKTWDENSSLFNAESLKNKRAIVAKLGAGGAVPRADEYGRPVWDLIEKDDNGNIVKVVEKGVNSARMKKLLEAVPNFNIDGTEGMKGDSLVKTFNENIGKERKTTVIKNGKEVETTFNPGSEDLAKIMAAEAIQDRDKLYNVFTRIGVNAEDDNSYTPENIKKAQDYLENKLIASAPTTVSEKPNYEGQKLALANRSQSEEEWYHRAQLAKDKEKTPKAIPLTVTRYANTGVDAQTGTIVQKGVFKIGITPTKGSPVKAITHNAKTGVTTAYVLNTKSDLLTQSGKDKIAAGNEDGLTDSDYINSQYMTRPVSSKDNRGEFNQIITTGITKDGKNGFDSYSDFYKSFSPAIKEAKSVESKTPSESKQKPKAIQFDAQGNIIM